MITTKNIKKIYQKYDHKNITIGVLGGHSALDVCSGAKKHGFRTVAVCQKGREKTYSQYYKSNRKLGCVDEVILVDKFADIINEPIQEQLRAMNTIFIHNRYFWVYFNFEDIENKFMVPIYGTRTMLKLEERNVQENQYYLMEKAGIRFPKIYKDPKDIDRLCVVKASEAFRGYERAFFFVSSYEDYIRKSEEVTAQSIVTEEAMKEAVIEEYVVGAKVNFNYFYSPLSGDLELMGTDTRRQTNLDGILNLPAEQQMEVLKYMKLKYIETGHMVCTIKESLLEKVFILGEKFVWTVKKEHPPGIIGPFALQGVVVAEEGREDIIIFDISMRIPGSPGTMFTPYAYYKYGNPISYGERIAVEIKKAVEENKFDQILT